MNIHTICVIYNEYTYNNYVSQCIWKKQVKLYLQYQC